MRILDSYKGRYLVEQNLPNKTLYEIYDLYNRVCSLKNRDAAIKTWSNLVSTIG